MNGRERSLIQRMIHRKKSAAFEAQSELRMDSDPLLCDYQTSTDGFRDGLFQASSCPAYDLWIVEKCDLPSSLDGYCAYPDWGVAQDQVPGLDSVEEYLLRVGSTADHDHELERRKAY